MSLYNILYTEYAEFKKQKPAFAGSLGFQKPDTWNLATAHFDTREEAEGAYDAVRPIYDDITANQTWLGAQQQNKTVNANEVSFRHHIWIDEMPDGSFAICVSFDKRKQTYDFMDKGEKLLNNNIFGFDHLEIPMSASDRINKYMGATHSVEIDIPASDFSTGLKDSFLNATGSSEGVLYTDLIRKEDGTVVRAKAYLNSRAAASQLSAKIENHDALGLYPDPVVRKFRAAKEFQPKRPQYA